MRRTDTDGTVTVSLAGVGVQVASTAETRAIIAPMSSRPPTYPLAVPEELVLGWVTELGDGLPGLGTESLFGTPRAWLARAAREPSVSARTVLLAELDGSSPAGLCPERLHG